MGIRLTYQGHSCFTLSCENYSAVIDPYPPYVPGYAPLRLKANEVFTSHGHRDHAYIEAVTLIPGGPRPFSVTTLTTSHDDRGGILRGMNQIHLFECNGIRVAHLGDVGCVFRDEKLELLKNLDVLLIPVGGTYTIDARQAYKLTQLLEARVVIPMHYRLGNLGFEEIDTLAAFTDLCADVTFSDGNQLSVVPDMPPQILVLKYGASTQGMAT